MKKHGLFPEDDDKIQVVMQSKKLLRSFLLGFIALFLSASPTFAAQCSYIGPGNNTFTPGTEVNITIGLDPNERPENLRVCNGDSSNGCYQIRACRDIPGQLDGGQGWCDANSNFALGSQQIEQTAAGPYITATFIAEAANYNLDLQFGQLNGGRVGVCGSYPWTISYDTSSTEEGSGNDTGVNASCESGALSVVPQQGTAFRANRPLFFQVNGSRTSGFQAGQYVLTVEGASTQQILALNLLGSGGSLPSASANYSQGLPAGNYQLMVRDAGNRVMCGNGPSFRVCAQGETSAECNITDETSDGALDPPSDFDYCAQVPSDQRPACEACVGENPENSGKIYTAVGCISTDQQGLAADLIRLLLGIAGGVALLSILAGAFLFTTSQGEANRVKQAKELITAAVSGLLFIIFSVIILDFIGVQVLQIPGLG